MSVMDDRDLILQCEDCGEGLTRHEFRAQLAAYAPLVASMGMPDLDLPACPMCGSSSITDTRTPEDRAYEIEVLSV